MEKELSATDSVIKLPWEEIGEIGLTVADYRQPFDVLHDHAFHEMVLVREGSGLHITDDYTTTIHRGDIFLILPGRRHTYENVKNLVITNILYIPEKLNLPLYDLKNTAGYYAFFEAKPQAKRAFQQRNCLTFNEGQLRIAEDLIIGIEQEQKKGLPGHEYFRKTAFMQLIGLISRAFPDNSNRKFDELTAISRIIRHFELNYAKTIHVDDLVPICGKSICQINRLFREAMGKSPISYLINLRLEKAAAMLRNHRGMSIFEVAFAVGFQDSNYFSKMFHHRFNLSPRHYRQEQQNCSDKGF